MKGSAFIRHCGQVQSHRWEKKGKKQHRLIPWTADSLHCFPPAAQRDIIVTRHGRCKSPQTFNRPSRGWQKAVVVLPPTDCLSGSLLSASEPRGASSSDADIMRQRKHAPLDQSASSRRVAKIIGEAATVATQLQRPAYTFVASGRWSFTPFHGCYSQLSNVEQPHITANPTWLFKRSH